MNRIKPRYIKIGSEEYRIIFSSHFLQRVKERFGDGVAINEIVEAINKGDIIRETPFSQQRHITDSNTIKVLCKIPFTKYHSVIVLCPSGFMGFTATTIYKAQFKRIHSEKYPLAVLTYKTVSEMIDVNFSTITEKDLTPA